MTVNGSNGRPHQSSHVRRRVLHEYRRVQTNVLETSNMYRLTDAPGVLSLKSRGFTCDDRNDKVMSNQCTGNVLYVYKFVLGTSSTIVE